jgi:hypothetical protein
MLYICTRNKVKKFMQYNRLISVTGLTGLFELVSSKQDGAIVRSLIDGKSNFISSRKHQFSHLEGIEVYTTGENVNLVDVFRAMQGSKEALPNAKDDAAIKAYFQKVYPQMDFDRVYVSDNRKMVKWYASIAENKIELPQETDENEAEAEAQIVAEKPKKEATVEAIVEKTGEEPKPKKTAKKVESNEDAAAPKTPKKTAKKTKED